MTEPSVIQKLRAEPLYYLFDGICVDDVLHAYDAATQRAEAAEAKALTPAHSAVISAAKARYDALVLYNALRREGYVGFHRRVVDADRVVQEKSYALDEAINTLRAQEGE